MLLCLCTDTAGNEGDGFASRRFILCDNCLKRPHWYSEMLLGSALVKTRADHRKLQKTLIQKMVENFTLDSEDEKQQKKERNALLALKKFEKRKVTNKSTFKEVPSPEVKEEAKVEDEAISEVKAKLLPKFVGNLKIHLYDAILSKIIKRFIVTLIIGFFYLHPWICKATFDLLSCEKVGVYLSRRIPRPQFSSVFFAQI